MGECPAKQKKNLEAGSALKGPGATAAEAGTAVAAVGEIANDIETGNQLRTLLVQVRSELQSAAGDKTRREELMTRLVTLLGARG